MSTWWNLLFPARCLGCRIPDTYLCPRCLAGVPPAEPIEIPEAVAVFSYHHPVIKRAIWRLKYGGITQLAATLAFLVRDRLLEYLAEEDALAPPGGSWLLVPVPASRRGRGYNQAALVARALARPDEEFLIYADLLTKTRPTPPQVSLKSRAARLNNLQNAFSAGPRAAGRRVIVIDDVITTGATMREARRALLAAGARKVIAAAVAHG